ncbi:MAG: hypothetical protein ACLS90_08685 [Clostridia bacterium]
MFIYNFKINGSKIFKYVFTFITILIIFILFLIIFRLFSGAKNEKNSSSCIPPSDINEISAKNYTNVLKTVHDNIDSYIGTKINFTGYVYRVLDLNNNQFILARSMIISSDFKFVVVGFLCNFENASKFANNTWVNVTGEIQKGDYHGDIPVIKVLDITSTEKPTEEYVYPPDDSYIPTNGLL